jgi:hypothetical protein
MLYRSFLAGGWSLVVRSCVVTISGILLTLSTVRGASALSPSQFIVDGPARFEILSPGLIRLEYAGDQKFQDSTTFNMIGRNNFGRTRFSTYARNGIRVIQTGNVTLKYLEGSGPFNSSNLQIALNNGSTQVVANPDWPNSLPVFQFGQLVEAEDTALAGGASIANNHLGYTGTGFVAGIQTVGAGGFHQYTEPDGSTSPADPDDLYVRWVQFATFQPILRLHSDHAYRLPWEYDDTAKGPAEQFLRLREALVPYTYTSAQQTIQTGVPFVHGLYIEFPGVQSAYDYSNQEYFYGPNLLVAPATTSGLTTSTEVWIPPGTWTNYFTGQQFTGPSVQSITTDLSSMPLFLKAGGIVPERTNNVTNDVQNPIDQVTFVVGAGSNGEYQLYDDQGDGTEYGRGQFATTDISYREYANQRELTIANARGQYQGQPATREWSAQFVGVNSPQTVMVPGIGTLPENTTGIGWSYNVSTRTLEVRVGAHSIKISTSIIVR